MVTWSVARACPIPVYQYALEHWPPDPYELVVEQHGELSAEQREALAFLQQAAQWTDAMAVNLRVQISPAPDPADPRAPAATRLELRYPEAARIKAPAWSGELNMANARALVQSPARQRLGDALVRRASAVWLLLVGGDRGADRDAETRLRQELARLEKVIAVPESADWGGTEVKLDHQVNFAVVVVRRDDPAEQVFVRLLLGTEPDLATGFAGEPMAFPVFGRGRVLHALVGRGINPWTIGEAVRFITGPCSCQIKEANPGVDLLLAVPWETMVEPTTPATVGGTTGVGGFLRGLDQAAPEGQPGTDDTPPPPEP